jgi:hypothetical protein
MGGAGRDLVADACRGLFSSPFFGILPEFGRIRSLTDLPPGESVVPGKPEVLR